VRFRRRASGKKGHGALWSIIYIDLMTQIMAFFVILWSVEHGSKLTATPSLGTGVGMGDQTARMVDLPGDVLFASGQTAMAPDGKAILDKLFGDADSGVLSFDQGGLAQRKLVIHGHTDDVGIKDANFQLGYQRAYAVYQEIRRHSKEVPDHIILCTHADNTPSRPVPPGSDRAAANDARSKNRRITIEDLVVATKPGETKPGETKPGETRPGGGTPSETKPGSGAPSEPKP
jgi:flagellar motor protein MotB